MVTGATGGLGRYFQAAQPDGMRLVLLGGRTAPQGGVAVDLSDRAAAVAALEAAAPDIIVHAAAMTDVDGCERDHDAAYESNVAATRILADWAGNREPGCRLVYISTDQVYPGPGPSDEKAAPRPINLYGWTKLWGEDIVLRQGDALVVRLNFVGAGTGRRRSLSDFLITSLSGGRAVVLFRDVFFSPLFGGDVPALLAEMIRQDASGIFNLGCSGGGSKADFGLGLAARLGLSAASATVGRLGDAALAAPRPLDTRMDVARAETLLRRRLPSFDAVMDRVAAEWRSLHGEPVA